jgi:beta-phosphoglucomutase-like phosphatase (HAD superfamily)
MTSEHSDAVGPGNHPFRAVLWDIDGTLLLSESMHFRALRHTLTTEGINVPDEFHHEIVGRAAKVVCEKCRQTFGLSISVDQWRRLKYSYYTAHAGEIASEYNYLLLNLTLKTVSSRTCCMTSLNASAALGSEQELFLLIR